METIIKILVVAILVAGFAVVLWSVVAVIRHYIDIRNK